MHAEPLDLFKLVLVGQRLISIHFEIDKSPRPKMNGCFGQVALFKQCRARKLLITPPGGHLKSGMTQCLILCLYLLYLTIRLHPLFIECCAPFPANHIPNKMIQNWLSAGFVRQWGTAHHFTKHHISNNIAQCINVCPIFFPADSGRHGAQHEPIHWCFSIRDLHGVFTGAQFFKRSTPCEIQWCIIICHIKTAIMPCLYKNQVCTFITKGIVRYTCSVVRAVGFNFYLHLDGQESWLRVYHESWPFFRPPCHLFSWEVTKVPVQYWLITM